MAAHTLARLLVLVVSTLEAITAATAVTAATATRSTSPGLTAMEEAVLPAATRTSLARYCDVGYFSFVVLYSSVMLALDRAIGLRYH